MMTTVIQLGLSLSILGNLFTIYSLFKAVRAQGDHLDSLTKLVLAMAESCPGIRIVSGNVVPFNLKK